MGATTSHHPWSHSDYISTLPFGQLLTKTTEILEYLVSTYKNLSCGSGTVLQS